MDYNFIEIEKKWSQCYAAEKPFSFKNDEAKKKFYCLEMFPYPSGRLHLGHVRNYTVGDVLARLRRLQGYNVLHPIGWDAFGLPAENAAIVAGSHPADWTFSNIKEMRQQLKNLGLSYDYEKEVCTAKKNYYKWGQWIFCKLHEAGLVYRKNAWVNWDPVDKTVLANEQVGEGGIAWRSGAVVEKKQIEQWYFKITDYAEELYQELNTLQGWSESVKSMQRNWIGRSEGASIYFKRYCGGGEYEKPVEKSNVDEASLAADGETFPIFTTRPDTIFNVTFMAISFDHPHLKKWIDLPAEDEKRVLEFADSCRSINQRAGYKKEGMFTGVSIAHPYSGKAIPLYVANFVLAEYGTGAIMGVPAFDERDADFAATHDILLKPTSLAKEAEQLLDLDKNAAIEKSIEMLIQLGIGKGRVTYKLRDWLISRQRYWGNPIPVVWDDEEEKPSYSLVDVDELPVQLPEDFPFANTPNPLQTLEKFSKVKINGNSYRRESDTMDTFTCSSWYFMRYFDTENTSQPFSKKLAERWLPVDQYIGGIEHACLHLLYARFIHKALRDLGLIASDEPFLNLLSQGMVLSKSYFCSNERRYYWRNELGGNTNVSPKGNPITSKIEAMSKSKNNGVDPEEIVANYGADSMRLAMLFTAPIERDMEWKEQVVEGCQRLLQRIFRMAKELKPFTKTSAWQKLFESEKAKPLIGNSTPSELSVKILRAGTVLTQKVADDIERMHYNTPIAAMMTFVNETHMLPNQTTSNEEKAVLLGVFSHFLMALSLYAPFAAEELAEMLSFNKDVYGGFVHNGVWPEAQEKFLEKTSGVIAVQVNGKLRATLNVELGMEKAELLKIAHGHENVVRWIHGKTIVKEIVVPEKVVNLVVK